MAVTYDPTQVQRLVDRMYSTALITHLFCALVGLAGLGATYLLPVYDPSFQFSGTSQEFSKYAALVVGLLFFLITLFIGRAAAEHQRAQAQLLLCQLQIERNTAKASSTPTPVA